MSCIAMLDTISTPHFAVNLTLFALHPILYVLLISYYFALPFIGPSANTVENKTVTLALSSPQYLFQLLSSEADSNFS